MHWYAMHNLKSLYYLRSDAAKSAENVNVKIPRINLEDVECLSCEGWYGIKYRRIKFTST